MYGSRIREMRKKRGLTLKEVAEATGYTIGHISQIERDLKSPSLVALRKIAACLDCSEVWLIMGDSELSVESSEEKNNSKETYLSEKRKTNSNENPGNRCFLLHFYTF